MATQQSQPQRSPQQSSQQTHQQILTQARQGDAPAIGLLIHQALTTRGIQVKAVRKGYCLHVLLEAVQPPDRQTYARVVYAAVLCLGAAAINQLQVYGRQQGALQPAWAQVFRIMEPDGSWSKPTVAVPPAVTPLRTQPTPTRLPRIRLSAIRLPALKPVDRSLVLSLFAASLGLGAGLSLLRHFEGAEVGALSNAVDADQTRQTDRSAPASPPNAQSNTQNRNPQANLPTTDPAPDPALAAFPSPVESAAPIGSPVSKAQPAPIAAPAAVAPAAPTPAPAPVESAAPVGSPAPSAQPAPIAAPVASTPATTPAAAQVAVTLKAVGDMIPGSNYSGRALLPTEPGEALNAEQEFLFGNIKPFLGESDLLFGNFESTLTDYPYSAKDTSQGMTFAFRTPPVYAQMLKNLGFDVLSVANNHSFDFGDQGFADTISHIEQAGMKAVGRKGQIVYTTANNVPIAFVGFSYLPDHNLMHDLEAGGALIREAKQKAKIVVVSVHAGAEGSDEVHTRNETEYFFGENRGNLVSFARGMIDQGADLVLGHGPHVPRALELYQNKLIAYSLGNFVGYKTLSTVGTLGDSLILTTQLTAEGDFVGGRIIPVALNSDGAPRLDDYFRSVVLIRNLIKQDFPDTPLAIDDMGYILRTDRPANIGN